MKKYTLGFIFNPAQDRVLLVHKLSPQWQAGKINGVGGKVEAGESGLDCIVREVREETALVIPREKWTYAGALGSKEWAVDVFGCIYAADPADARSAGKERVEWFKLGDLPPNAMANLSWLIPLTLDKMQHGSPDSFRAEYK